MNRERGRGIRGDTWKLTQVIDCQCVSLVGELRPFPDRFGPDLHPRPAIEGGLCCEFKDGGLKQITDDLSRDGTPTIGPFDSC
jgi:hypothetical protein